MKETGLKFIELAEKYGFKTQKSWDGSISLKAENSDGKYVDWIVYNKYTDDVFVRGNTDNLNLWLNDTRPDLTPEDLSDFVKSLNKCLGLPAEDRLTFQMLIAPEDWQELAGVQNALRDPRYYDDFTGENIMSDKHLIWSNLDLDIEDYRDGYADFLEINNLDKDPDDENAIYDYMVEYNNECLGDERANLNIQLSQSILVIADLGRWNGRSDGYKEIESGNIKDCLYADTDYSTWFVDKDGDFRCDAVHHDGTNHYLYRVYKDDVTDEQIDDLKEKIYNGVATHEDVDAVTRRLGDEIGKVYGWEFPQKEEVASLESQISDAEKAKSSASTGTRDLVAEKSENER